jgi:hypothetical protein
MPRLLPVDLEVRDKTRYEHKIERPVARDLVGDADVPALGIAHFLFSHRPSFADPRRQAHALSSFPLPVLKVRESHLRERARMSLERGLRPVDADDRDPTIALGENDVATIERSRAGRSATCPRG